MRVKILKKMWTLKWVPNLGQCWGDCSDRDAPGRTVRFKQGLKGQDELEVLLHEFLHCGGFHLSEEFVDEWANDVARILYKLGYRKVNDATRKD